MIDATFLNGEFINLYSKENPHLNAGDFCYGLIFNNKDYHYPIVVKCKVIQDKFNDGLNKQYYCQILEIVETPNVINNFIIGQPFNVYPYYNGIDIHSKKIIQLSTKFKYDKYLFMIDSFFVRPTYEQIIELRNYFKQVIKQDLMKMLSDLE